MNSKTITWRHGAWLLSAVAAAALTACGGGSGGSDIVAAPRAASSQDAAELASGITTVALADAQLTGDAASLEAQPTFHLAPVLLDAPDDVDAASASSSALRAPHAQAVPAGMEGVDSTRLTVQGIDAATRSHALGADGSVKPSAASTAISTYTPAQIRAAYGLSTLPSSFASLTAAQAAQLGAGQTIYIVDAMHDTNLVAELAAFNAKFGLPGCTVKAIAPTATLPLAAASTSACELSVVSSATGGTMTSKVPAYNAGWATEIALDVQWAHATAPLARIVLIEAPDASLNSLLDGVKLANAMGPGVVSMSFGATEGSYTASVDAAFSAPRMTYLASTGDSGAAVAWPSVSPKVVAVGGTSLSWSGAGSRSEVAWAGTGGGTSAYTATPSYQTNAVPGLGTVARRTVADVAFNANPSTGQYVAVMAPGATAVSWVSAGGTSLSAPQWAGLVAVANAVRAQTSQAPLGDPHVALYNQIAATPGTYASVFADIVSGTNGSCGTCSSKTGYDPLTGLGTPNVGSLLSALSGSSVAAAAPVVTAASIGGKVGTALSFTASATSSNAVTWSATGMPSGMTVSSAGAVAWAAPVAGSYAVTLTAKDSQTGLAGSAVYTVTIAAATVVVTPPAPTATGPVITAPAVTGTAGKALTATIAISDPAARSMQISIGGAPMGMGFSISGLTITGAWPKAVAGSYALQIVVLDSLGKTATATLPIRVN
jgi:subtilase family serine protease